MAEQFPITIDVHYEKSQYFRVVHADGIYGGMSPSGTIHVAFFSQRTPLPKSSSLTINPDHTSVEAVTDVKKGAFREIEVDVSMDLSTSLAFLTWLTQNVNVLRKQLGMPDEAWGKTIEAVNAAAK